MKNTNQKFFVIKQAIPILVKKKHKLKGFGFINASNNSDTTNNEINQSLQNYNISELFEPLKVPPDIQAQSKNNSNLAMQEYLNKLNFYLPSQTQKKSLASLTEEQKSNAIKQLKKIKGNSKKMKLFFSKMSKISIYYLFIEYIFNNPIPVVPGIVFESHHIEPIYMIKEKNILFEDIHTNSNLIELTPSLHLLAHIFRGYSFNYIHDIHAINAWRGGDISSLMKFWKNRENSGNLKNQSTGMIEIFFKNINSFWTENATHEIDRHMSDLRKKHSRNISKNSNTDANIIQLLTKTRIWAIEGRENETRVILDPTKTILECTVDISLKILDCTPINLKPKSKPSMTNYTNYLKRYLSGNSGSFFSNWRLENYQDFNFPHLQKENVNFQIKKAVFDRLSQEHGVYYHLSYPVVSFLEVKPNEFDIVNNLGLKLKKLSKGNNFDLQQSYSSTELRGLYNLLQNNDYQKSWDGWYYFPYSDLKKNETIDSHIIYLNEINSAVPIKKFLNQTNIF